MVLTFEMSSPVSIIVVDTKTSISPLIKRYIIPSSSRSFICPCAGLLIIDEEQRFGVAHKEKIKQLKYNVDVLTLTATPIPRTLHMSLIGIRDMSLLEVTGKSFIRCANVL